MTQTDLLDETTTEPEPASLEQLPTPTQDFAATPDAPISDSISAPPAEPAPAIAPLPVAQGNIDHLCHLDSEWLLVHGWFPGEAGPVNVVVIGEDGTVRPIEVPPRATCLAHPRLDAPIPDALAGKVVVVFIKGGLRATDSLGVIVPTQEAPVKLGPARLNTVEVEPAEFANGMKPLAKELRDGFLDAVRQLIGLHAEPGALSAYRRNQRLAELRAAVRQPALSTVPGRDVNGLGVESLLSLDGTTFFITGWLWCDDAPPVRLSIVSPEGFRAELLPTLHTFDRPDIEQLYGVTPAGNLERHPGFASLFELPAACATTASLNWLLELEDARGVIIEVPCPRVVRSPAVFEEAMLNLLARTPDGQACDRLLELHIEPGVRKARAARFTAAAASARSTQFGPIVATPAVSLVLTTDQPPTSIEHQIAAFAADSTLGNVEIIYVVNERQGAASVDPLCAPLHELYRVPFVVLTLNAAPSRAAALEIGFQAARGSKVLFGRANVIPSGSGWLPQLLAMMNASLGCAIISPKLLREDGSIGHAGLRLTRRSAAGNWSVERTAHGLPNELAQSNGSDIQPAKAVGLDWTLVDAAAFREAGGLNVHDRSDDVVAMDLSLRLAAQGKQTFFASQIELHCPFAPPVEGAIVEMRFSEWMFNRRWRESINSTAEVTSRHSPH